MGDVGRFVILSGIILVVIGFIMTLGFPKLPGDIAIKRDGFFFYFPWVTSIVISIIVTILLNIFLRK